MADEENAVPPEVESNELVAEAATPDPAEQEAPLPVSAEASVGTSLQAGVCNKPLIESFEIQEKPPKSTKRSSRLSRISNSVIEASGASGYPTGKSAVMSTIDSGGTAQGMNGMATDASEKADGLTEMDVVFSLLLSLLGSGMVVLPKVMADVGMITASVLLVTTAFASYACALNIIRSCDLAEKLLEKPPGSLKTFEQVAQAALGTPGEIFLTVGKNFYFLGIIVVYFTFETDAFSGVFEGKLSPTTCRWALVLPIFASLAMLYDLSIVKKVAFIGIIACVGQVSGMFFGALYEIVYVEVEKGEYKLSTFEAGVLGAAMATCMFAFSAIATLPSIRSQMQNSEELPSAVMKGLSAVASIYLVIMWTGYVAFGPAVESNMMKSISGANCCGAQCWLGSGASLSIMFNLFMSYPTFVFCVMSSLEATGNDAIRTTMSVPNIVFRILLIFGLCFVSWVVSCAKEIIGLGSAFFGTCINVFYPIVCCFVITKRLEGRASIPPTSIALLVLGSLVMIFGCWGGGKNLIKALSVVPVTNSSENVSIVNASCIFKT